jgi:hypothetical protein
MSFVRVTLAGLLSSGLALQDSAPPLEVPDAARESLEATWRDWAPAELTSDASCLDGAARTSMVSADLDSDGHPDYALAVRAAGGLRLAAVLHRIPKFVTFELDDLGADGPATLALAPRGGRFVPASGVDDFFPAETILVRRCGQPDVAYLWTGFSFRKTPLGGGTAPAPAAR